MSKKLLSIDFYVTLLGPIWQGIDCTKEKHVTFTPEKQPFTTEWKGLKNALSQITHDGDFQYCQISWGCMVVKWYDGKYFLEQQVEIPDCKLTHEFLAEA